MQIETLVQENKRGFRAIEPHKITVMVRATWLLDQKNFERSEILGFYLYLRPAIQDFTVFAFTTPRHVNYRIGHVQSIHWLPRQA